MAEKDDSLDKETRLNEKEHGQQHRGSVALGADDAGAIPKGTIDPVYEAKARVLNRAVSASSWAASAALTAITDSRHWHGMVSMATLYSYRFWLGK